MESQKIKENSKKPNEGRIGRDPVLGPFLRPFLKIKITQCVTATKIWLLEIATVYEGKTAKWRPILELQRGPGAFYSQTGVLSDPSVRPCVRACVRPPKSGDSPNGISIGFTAPSGCIISRVDFRNLKKSKKIRKNQMKEGSAGTLFWDPF